MAVSIKDIIGFIQELISNPEKMAKFKENHKGCLNCVDLLRQNKEAGGDKKAHCDACVYECVKIVEELL